MGEAVSELGGGESTELSQEAGVKKKSKNRGRKRRGIIDDANDEKVGVRLAGRKPGPPELNGGHEICEARKGRRSSLPTYRRCECAFSLPQI